MIWALLGMLIAGGSMGAFLMALLIGGSRRSAGNCSYCGGTGERPARVLDFPKRAAR